MIEELFCLDDDIICPYCNNYKESNSILDEEKGAVKKCTKCGRYFLVDIFIKNGFLSSGDCEINGEKHDLHQSLGGGDTHDRCHKCDRLVPKANEPEKATTGDNKSVP